MIVKKKGLKESFEPGSSSSMIGAVCDGGEDRYGSKEAEEELYRLMRGDGYETEEEEDEVTATDGEEEVSAAEAEPVVSPVEPERIAVCYSGHPL
jgi:hypothetical protein